MPGKINLIAVIIICIISAILIRGIRESARFNDFIVIIKVAVVVFFIGIGYFFINYKNYHPFLPPNTGQFGAFGWSGVLAGAGQIFFAYIGFDAVSTAAQEARNPKRDMPIGIIGSLAICTVLYILYSLVLTGIVNYKDLNVAAPLAVAVDHMKGLPWIGFLMKLGLAVRLDLGNAGHAAGAIARVLSPCQMMACSRSCFRMCIRVPYAVEVQSAADGVRLRGCGFYAHRAAR